MKCFEYYRVPPEIIPNNQRNDEEMDNTINNKEVIKSIRIKTYTLKSDSLSTLLFMLLI